MSELKKTLRVLVADDDQAILRTLLLSLKALKCEVKGVESAEAALETMRGETFDALLTDVRMSGMSGIELIQEARGMAPDMVCAAMTAFASYENAVEAIKAGAFDYLPKPFSAEQLEHLIKKIATVVELRRENAKLRAETRAASANWFEGLTSPASIALRAMVDRIAPSDATMLLTGETGSGKTELARYIHQHSNRADKPFVEVVCTAITETLFESEVFGHVRGAFTGAIRDHAGKFETADNGTLFLDEIGELSPVAQTKLLRFLEDQVIERVGDNRPLRLNVRILAATNRDLRAMVEEKTFREDLYYRLNVFECTVPALRDRKEDIPPLVMRLLHTAAAKYAGNTIPKISEPAMAALLAYSWPGNIRELRNVMDRATLLSAGREIRVSDLPPALLQTQVVTSGGAEDHISSLREMEEEHIRRVLDLGVSMDRAAEILGITTVTLWRKRKELGLV